MASVDITDQGPQNKPKIYTILCSQKAPCELLSVQDFRIDNVDDGTIDVYLHFQIKQLHAQLLTFISKSFTYLVHDPDIKHLTKDDFKLLLKHKHLNVTQEDEVIRAICLWMEGQT